MPNNSSKTEVTMEDGYRHFITHLAAERAPTLAIVRDFINQSKWSTASASAHSSCVRETPKLQLLELRHEATAATHGVVELGVGQSLDDLRRLTKSINTLCRRPDASAKRLILLVENVQAQGLQVCLLLPLLPWCSRLGT